MASVTRETLYGQVWAKPMTSLATEYGVTSTALKKTCNRHNIPTPPRGYWQQLAHGQPVKRTPLPDQASAPGSIAIGENNRIPAVDADNRKDDPNNWTRAAETIGELVPESKILAATRRAFRKLRSDHQGFVSVRGTGLLGLKITKPHLDRALLIASRLIAVAEAGGRSVAMGDGGLTLNFDGTLIAFSIEEECNQESHSPTEAEFKRGKENARWGMSSTPWPKYDYYPSGRLAVVIEGNQYSGLRRTFADGKKQKLEELMGKILQSFSEHAIYSADKKRAAEAYARAAAEAEARRERQKAYEAREKRRWEIIDAVHDQLARRNRLVAVLAYLGETPSQTLPIANWIREKIRMIDALLSADFLDLSARSAKIGFSEDEATPDEHYSYYYQPAALHYWKIDEGKGMAESVSAVEWLHLNTSVEARRSTEDLQPAP